MADPLVAGQAGRAETTDRADGAADAAATAAAGAAAPPPPEEKIEEPLPQDTPEEAPPDDAAPAEQLGLDAEGVAGSDGFGLAARKGGQGLGLGGAAFAWYTALLKDSILDALSADERLRKGTYQLTVRVWLTSGG